MLSGRYNNVSTGLHDVTATDTRVRLGASPCDEQSAIGTGFSPSTSVFPSQYHSIIARYSFSSITEAIQP